MILELFAMAAILAVGWDVEVEKAVLTLSGAAEIEELSEEEMERFRSLAAHPLDINAAGRSRLASRTPVPIPSTWLGVFFIAFAANAGVTLHVRTITGENSHHIIEGAFKAFGRAMKQAAAIDPALGDAVPSTKGML